MKVTVSFGDMRIIVPCGDGDLLISELMERATNRYKRATQKGEHCVVQVKYLETVKERARLDADDQVMDVCDDKDMLTAIYNENNKHVKIDDVVQVRDGILVENKSYTEKDQEDAVRYIPSALSDNDSGVAADACGLSNLDSTHASLDSSSKPPRGPAHRQHAKTKNSSFRSSSSSNSSPELPVKHLLNVNAFARDSNRKSLSSNHPILYKWIDQQETNFVANDKSQEETDSDKSDEEIRLDQDSMKSIDIKPYTNAEGVEIGLIVQSIVEGGNVNYLGELQVADRITEINGESLQGLSNVAALDIFNSALKCGEVTAKRTRSHSFVKESLSSALTTAMQKLPDVHVPTLKQLPKQTVEEVKDIKESAVEAPIVHTEEQESNIFTVNLVKGSNGLGFTVTSKDVITSKTTRIFIKNILRNGAASEDGRIEAGDELLMVNNVAVGGKTQGDVVKLLRQSEGAVVLKLSRLKGSIPQPSNVPPPIAKHQLNISNVPPSIAKNQPNITVSPPITKNQSNISVPPYIAKNQLNTSPETFPATKRPTLSPLLKAAVTSHMKPVISISPLAQKSDPSSITTSQQRTPIPVSNELDHSSPEIKEKRVVVEEVAVCKGCINLTIPLIIQENVGLGISVKGKIMKETGEEKGIFVKSIVPGSNAEKDGRIQVGDQLLFVNNVSLKNMSNSTAMTLLKNTLAESAKDGVIRINVNRFVQSTDSTDNDSTGSLRSATVCNQVKINKVDNKKDVEKNSELMLHGESFSCNEKKENTLSNNHGISRTKSYFKAIHRPTSPKQLESSSQPLFFQPDTSTRKDKGKVTNNEQVVENGKLWGVNVKNKDFSLPTYEQALQYKETKSQSGTPPKSGASSHTCEGTKNTFMKSISLESNTLPRTKGEMLKVERGFSTISQSSLDSVLTDSQRVTFARDGPGRLSMSEKKGRGQIDATKSHFYNKLKKFRSMEELRATDGEDFRLNNDFGDMDIRRASSIDTLASVIDDNEKNACLFNRGTVYSASTPYFANEEQKGLAGKSTQDYDSFKIALERASSNPTYPSKKKESPDEKKKKGFLNSIGIFLKRAKKRKEDELAQGHSPTYITNPEKFPFDRKALLEVYEDVENNNKNIGDNLNPGISDHSKYLQADRLQMKLVEEKINEMHMRDRKDKNKRHDFMQKGNIIKNEGKDTIQKSNIKNEGMDNMHKGNSKTEGTDTMQKGNVLKNEGMDTMPKTNIHKNEGTKGSDEKDYTPLTGYHTWQSHDPKNMREKSKQFFMRDPGNNQFRSSSNLQRQHSLPPKNSTEVHRVLPRAPSGPMYKSPDRSKVKSEYGSPPSLSNNRQHEPRNMYRKSEREAQQRTPGKLKSNSENSNHKNTENSKRSEFNARDEKDGKVTLRVKRLPSLENSSPLNNHNPKTTTHRRSMPTITDLKLRGSVSISHKAEI